MIIFFVQHSMLDSKVSTFNGLPFLLKLFSFLVFWLAFSIQSVHGSLLFNAVYFLMMVILRLISVHWMLLLSSLLAFLACEGYIVIESFMHLWRYIPCCFKFFNYQLRSFTCLHMCSSPIYDISQFFFLSYLLNCCVHLIFIAYLVIVKGIVISFSRMALSTIFPFLFGW